MANNVPSKYSDPYWSELSSKMEQKVGLPTGLLNSIVNYGERSNHDQVSSAGAKTVYQITPPTAELIKKKYGIDPYLSPENAAESAALLLKESLARNNNKVNRAIAEYHGGTDTKNWGKITNQYVNRVMQGMAQRGGVDNAEIVPASMQSGSAPQKQQQDVDQLSQIISDYKSNKLSDDERKEFEQLVNGGSVFLNASTRKSLGLTPAPTEQPRNDRQLVKEFTKYMEQKTGNQYIGQQDPSILGQIESVGRGGFAGVGYGLTSAPRLATYPLAKLTGNETLQAIDQSIGKGADWVDEKLSKSAPSYYRDLDTGEIKSTQTDARGNKIATAAGSAATMALAPARMVGQGISKFGSMLANPAAETAVTKFGDFVKTAGALNPSNILGGAAAGGTSKAIELEGGGIGSQIGGGIGAAVLTSALTKRLGLPTAPVTSSITQNADNIPAITSGLPDNMPNVGAATDNADDVSRAAAAELEGIQGAPSATTSNADRIRKALEAENAASGDGLSPEELAQYTNELTAQADYLAANKDLALQAMAGDADALGKLAADANIDENLLQSFKNIGIGVESVPVGVVAKNTQVQSLTGAGASQVGSAAEARHLNFVKNVADRLNQVAQQDGKQLAQTAENIRATVDDNLKVIGQQVDDAYTQLGNKIAAAADENGVYYEAGKRPLLAVEANNSKQFLDDILAESTGIDQATGKPFVLKNALPSQFADLKQLVDGGATYSALDTIRKKIGAALGGQKGEFVDAETGMLKNAYRAISDDLEVVGQKYGFADDVAKAKQLNIQKMATQDELVNLFGKALDKDFVKPLLGALNDVANKGANNQRLASLIKVMPEQYRAQAINGALYQTLVKGGEGINWARMANFWGNLNNINPSGANIIKSALGEEAFKRWGDIANVSKAVSNYERYVLKTGKALYGNIEQEANAGKNIVARTLAGIGNLAANKAAGATGGVFTGAINSGIDWMFNKAVPRATIASLAKVLNDPSFLKAARAPTERQRMIHINALSKKSIWRGAFGNRATPQQLADQLPPLNNNGIKSQQEPK